MALSEINNTELTEFKPIYKPGNQYNLQEVLGLKNEKQRWLSYLETLRECLYEKNVDFNTSYRTQKHVITSQIVRAFKKKAPDFPLTAGDWAIKEMLISTIQNKRYYLKKKKDTLRVPPPRNSPQNSPTRNPSPQNSPARNPSPQNSPARNPSPQNSPTRNSSPPENLSPAPQDNILRRTRRQHKANQENHQPKKKSRK